MKYKMNTNANGQRLETIAQQENEILIRIYFNGKFLNYLFDPVDVRELGLSAIFDMIDPDPELANAEALYAQVLDHRQPVLARRSKKRKQVNSLD
jgi:hypothetical protein